MGSLSIYMSIRTLASGRGSDPRARITATGTVRGPEGEPLGEPKFSDLPAYTICLWRFSQKSQFLGANLRNLTSFKYNQNFLGHCHCNDKDRVEK